MSVRRPFIWTCDHPECDEVVIQDGYGLPKGWIYIPQLDGPIIHRCDKCEKKRKEKFKK